MDKDLFMAAERLKAVYEILADIFDSPCNYVFIDESVDEYMLDCAGDWCAENCGKVSDAVCWEKYLELKVEERRAPDAFD